MGWIQLNHVLVYGWRSREGEGGGEIMGYVCMCGMCGMSLHWISKCTIGLFSLLNMVGYIYNHLILINR